jgi:hypothetical protein
MVPLLGELTIIHKCPVRRRRGTVDTQAAPLQVRARTGAGTGDTLRVVSMKVELKGTSSTLMRSCTCSLPPDPGVRGNGVHYLLADDIDNRPQGVQYYEVAPKILKTVNGLARVTDSAYQPVELSGYYFEGEQRHVVVSAETVVTRIRLGTPTVLVTNSEAIWQAPPPPPGPQHAAVAAAYPVVTEALTLMSQPAALGWTELYKVFEVVRDSVKPIGPM